MLTISYVNMWKSPPEEYWFTKYFKQIFDKDTRIVKPTEYPDILICSCMGPIQTPQSLRAKLKIFFYGENLDIYPPYNNDKLIQTIFDMSIGFKNTDISKNQIRFPLWMLYYPYYSYDTNDNILTHIEKRRELSISSVTKQDASLVARHDFGGQRTILYNELSKHIKVWCPSQLFNNTPRISDGNEAKHLYIRDTLYNICPENSKFEGYHTEKIFQALEAGCIPIYWAGSIPEPEILNTNCYCFADINHLDILKKQIQNIVKHPDTYQGASIYTKGAHKHIQQMYTTLTNHIRNKLSFKRKEVILSTRYISVDIPTYYINLERSKERNATMQKMYPHATRIDAYDGKHLERYQNIVLPKESSSSSYEFACSLSHIKAIHTAYQAGVSGALILEDDSHTTYQHTWIQPLETIIKRLPDDADCVTFVCSNSRELVGMLQMDVMFSKWNPERWSTGAYYITRKGMKKVLSRFLLPGNKYTLNVDGLTRHCADNDVVYTPINTYSYTRPTFVPECKDSVIHETHLGIHKTALSIMIQFFDIVLRSRNSE